MGEYVVGEFEFFILVDIKGKVLKWDVVVENFYYLIGVGGVVMNSCVVEYVFWGVWNEIVILLVRVIGEISKILKRSGINFFMMFDKKLILKIFWDFFVIVYFNVKEI